MLEGLRGWILVTLSMAFFCNAWPRISRGDRLLPSTSQRAAPREGLQHARYVQLEGLAAGVREVAE
jgi:hypothetical protein